jgi:signal transduction histidine kinase
VVNQWPSRLSFPPAIFILLTLLVTTALQGMALYTLMQQPWTGIQTRPDSKSGHIRITAITADSPAAEQTRLQPLQILTQLQTTTVAIRLTNDGRDEYLSAGNYAELDKRIVHQTALWRALTSGQNITLTTQTGERVTFLPQRFTPLSGIPGYIWVLLPFHILLPLVGSLVWLYKPHTLESMFLYLAGISYSLFGAVFCMLYQREFTLDPTLILPLTALGNASMFLLGLSLCAILTYYPQRVLGLKALWVYAGLWLILSLNYHFRWAEAPLHIFIFQFLVLYVAMVLVSYRQWRAAQRNPVNRVTLLVLHFSTQVPTGLTILLYAIPTVLGKEPFITPLIAHIFIMSMFGGWVAGIVRFRLFEAEYWCFKSLMWAFGGSLVIASDILLVGLLKLSETYALGLSIVVAGFVYFPLRQWILGRFTASDRQTLREFLPTFSAAIADAVSPPAFEASWKNALQQRFQPLHIALLPEDTAQGNARLENHGLHLFVPTLQGNGLYQITGKHLGAHLFGKIDITMAHSLLSIARMVSNASEARHRAVLEERQRIMHDLHDTVGARLLTMSHTLPTHEHQAEARETLQVLRDTVKLSLKQAPLRFGDHLADWRAELTGRLEAKSIELVWESDEKLDSMAINPRHTLELTNILRELVTNSLKHAKPTKLYVSVTRMNNHLTLYVANDGTARPPENWQEGTGLTSLRRRASALQGEISFQFTSINGLLAAKVKLPLP